MPITILSQASSLNPGSDLWIVPPLEKSRSSQRMDWYLNFQLLKASLHEKPKTSASLQSILTETGLTSENFEAVKPGRLLLSSVENLPNRWLVQVQTGDDFEAWCREIDQIWTGLGRPSLRVFLPTGLNAGEFQNLWKRQQTFDDFTLVVD